MVDQLKSGCRGLRHHLTNRTRLKVSKKFRHAGLMEELVGALSRIDTISSTECNLKTGSVLIHHERDHMILKQIQEAIGSTSIDLLEDMIREDEVEDDNVSILAMLINSYATRANRGFRTYTGNQLDLKTLLPLVFVGLGITKASGTSRWWDQTPAYLFFYWAYDAFLRFHLYRIEEKKQNGSMMPISLN